MTSDQSDNQKSERYHLIRDAFTMVSASHIAIACGAATSILLRTAIVPAVMGIWSTIRVTLDYANFGSLGVNRSAGLRIAISLGKNDEREAERLANVAVSVEMLVGIVVAVGIGLASSIQFIRGEYDWGVAFLIGVWLAVVGRYHAFCLTILRSHKRFKVISMARVVGAIADLTLVAGGAWLFGFVGLLLGAAITVTFNAIFVTFVGQLRFRFEWDRVRLFEMLAEGWPMAGAAFALISLRSIDRLVIINCMPDGKVKLGWYSVPVLMGGLAFDQSTLIANVIFPRLAETLGKTNSHTAVLRVGLRTAEVLAWSLVLCCALVLVVAVPVLSWLLPQYRPGLVASNGILAAGAVVGISMPIRYALVTIGKPLHTMIVTFISAGVLMIGSYWVVTNGGDLLEVSWWSASCGLGCLVGLLLVSFSGDAAPLSLLMRVFGSATYLAVGLVFLRSPLGQDSIWWILVIAWGVFPMIVLARFLKIRSLLAERRQ